MNKTSIPRALVTAAVLSNMASGQAQEAKLVALDGAFNDHFGWSVSVDGDTAIVGAPETDEFGSNTGSAYVFVETAGVWTQEAKLSASNPGDNDQFGASVDIDGNWVIVGALEADGVTANTGAAYVYRRSGQFPFATWAEHAVITASDGLNGDCFGSSVAIEGDRVVIGAPDDDGVGTDSGSAYVFTRNGGTWSQSVKLMHSATTSFQGFGNAVAIDADLIAVGASLDDELGSNAGAAYLFREAGGVWSEEARLLASNGTISDLFGSDLDIDSGRVAVGAQDYGMGGPETGAVYVFEVVSSNWQETAFLLPGNPLLAGEFGQSLGFDAGRIVAGAPNASQPVGGNAGIVYVFEDQGGVWIELGTLTPQAPKGSINYGHAVGLSGDRAVVGAIGDSGTLPSATGAAYVHSLVPPAPQAYCTAKVNSIGCTPAISSEGVPSASVAQPFLVEAAQVLNNRSGLLFYSVVAKAAVPFQGGLLCVNPPVKRTPIQNSGGNPPPTDCSGVFSLDFNARIQSGVDPSLVPGQEVYCQYWYRDSGSASTTGLSDGLELIVGF